MANALNFNGRQLRFYDDETSDNDKEKQSITIQIFENCQSILSYGLYLWPCSVVLGQFVWFHRNKFIGKTILEIGAGTAVPGLVAAKIGAQRVILCDDAKLDGWFPLIRQIITGNAINADRLQIDSLDWFNEKSIEKCIETHFTNRIDVIFGADIFFHKKDFQTILACLDRFFTCGDSKLIFYGTIERRCRSNMLKLNYLASRWQMEFEITPLHSFAGDSTHVDIIAGHDIVLFTLKKHKEC